MLWLEGKPEEENKSNGTKDAILLAAGFKDITTTTMLAYLTDRLIYGYIHKELDIIRLLKTRYIWLIPSLNQDGFELISNLFSTNNSVTPVRKNRNNQNQSICGTYILYISITDSKFESGMEWVLI